MSMMSKNCRTENGFTLVETLAATAIGLIMLLSIYGAINMAQKSTTGIDQKVVAQQDARVALELMATEIRMASYDLTLSSSIWVDPATCVVDVGTPVPLRRKGIREATPTTLTVEMDINDSGAVGDASNEIISYAYLSGDSDLRITRETVRCPTSGRTASGAQPFLGASAGGTAPRTVRVINQTVNVPVFRYYNGRGTEIFPTAGDQTAVPNIRRIDITLAAETEDIDPATKERRRIIYGTSVITKNHGITVNTASP
jgi:prepilin-type N-terminal cleavage/methylation domain-containing protein